jgi:hypothetical protein
MEFLQRLISVMVRSTRKTATATENLKQYTPTIFSASGAISRPRKILAILAYITEKRLQLYAMETVNERLITEAEFERQILSAGMSGPI